MSYYIMLVKTILFIKYLINEGKLRSRLRTSKNVNAPMTMKKMYVFIVHSIKMNEFRTRSLKILKK